MASRIAGTIIARALRRKPDFIIGGADRPYMRRWWLIPRNRVFNVYLHQILRDDDDRALHDHPWFNCSILLRGAYYEVMPTRGATLMRRLRTAGSVVLRSPWAAHRLEVAGSECWSLFLTGPLMRRWGFWCPQGWRYWKDFVAVNDPGAVGPGCGDDPTLTAGALE